MAYEGMAMEATLLRAVRDHNYGRWHQPGERVELLVQVQRADFDHRHFWKVRFSDRTEGVLFDEEIGQPLDKLPH